MKKTGGYVAATVLLVLISAFCVAGTVKSQGREEPLSEQYYLELEREYVKSMRAYLNEAGFADSGVMLTRTVYEDGSREYHITIHHSRFDRLTEAEKESLLQILREKAFEEPHCSFVHSLTGNA